MSVLVLLTGCALIGCGFSVYFAWCAGVAAERAAHSEHRLSVMRGQVAGMEAALEALNTKHNKLAGRVYADEYWNGKRAEQPELQPSTPDWRVTFGDVCDNWKIAQRDGPSSPAAGCECVYCNNRREDRARRRASMRSGVKT